MTEMARTSRVKRYVHNQFTFEYNGVKASCSEDGKVTLTQEHDDETFDEVTVSANMIYKLGEMLNTSKKVKYVNRDEVDKK